MKINYLRRINDNIYELNYTNVFGVYKTIKVFQHVFRWKRLENGSNLSFEISCALRVMSNTIEIGEIAKINPTE